MYGEDFEDCKREALEEAARFQVRDSGAKAQYGDGMQRDTAEGKPKFRLMWPKGLPYEQQLIYRVAMHYTAGGKKYGDRNWEKSCTPESLAHHEDALERHFHKYLEGVEDGEDHAAAIVWNVNAVLLTRWNIEQEERRAADALDEDDDPGEETETDERERLHREFWEIGQRAEAARLHMAKARNRFGVVGGFPSGTEVLPATDYAPYTPAGSLPKFGTPEFDAKVAEVAAEQAKSWPKTVHVPIGDEGLCLCGCSNYTDCECCVNEPKAELSDEAFEAAKKRNTDLILQAYGLEGFPSDCGHMSACECSSQVPVTADHTVGKPVVTSDHTAGRTASQVFTFPILPHTTGSVGYAELRVKAASLEAARAEVDAILGRSRRFPEGERFS